MTEEERSSCHTIIHSASASCAGIGAGLAQAIGSDTLLITPIQITMIIALGKVFNKDISESVAKSLLMSLGGALVGRGVASVLVGWIPGIGNVINASTAAGVTEAIGWAAAKHFDEN